ncbi:unnamed protein product [Caenorhabditis sp. 36 PRJEB53466]|nr:unnamed protein product [Caenorhabditis sp. 36 PRJEB53466]
MEATPQKVSFHIPPVYILVGVVMSCLIIGYLSDFIMQKYGCCGRKGGCCRKENATGAADICETIPLTPLRGSIVNDPTSAMGVS